MLFRSKAESRAGLSLDVLDLEEATLKSFTEYEEHRLLENLKDGNPLYSVDFGFSFEAFDTQLKEASERLEQDGEVISTLPSGAGDSADKIYFRLIYASQKPQPSIEAVVEPYGGAVSSLLKKPPSLPKSEPPPEPPSPAGSDDSIPSFQSMSPTVRVDIHKLDEAMAVVGDLTLHKGVLDRLYRDLSHELGDSPLALELMKTAREFDRKLSALQTSIIGIRMVPISQIFNKLSRAARKIAASCHKKVEMHFSGGDTELDKIMIEEITNPFIHLIRNAIDHGIESPDERKSKGKSESGNVHLKAYPKGNSVVVEISDDGAGIRVEKIAEIAAKRGLIPPNAELSFNDCTELLFSPGFSSSDAVSDVSGRGVGLDVVKENLSRLKGTINVRSEPDAGTSFELQLPITLAMLQVLFVDVADKRFAVPLTSVVESLRIEPSRIQSVEHREVVRVRDLTIPLVRLQEFFGVHNREKTALKHLYVVIVQSAEKRAGLVVDRLTGEQEVVIKSMGKHQRFSFFQMSSDRFLIKARLNMVLS